MAVLRIARRAIPLRIVLLVTSCLQRFFAKYELTSPYALCSSDCEPLSMSEALDLADEECKQM